MFGRAVDILLTVAAVSLIILVHEFGHFIAARAVGIRVTVFSIGFWKRIVGFRKGHTDYRLSLIPLGGYVRVAGEVPGEATGEPYELWSKTPGQRAIFIIGGVAMNLVLALVLFILAFSIGVPFTVAEVGQTIQGEPAWKAGLKPGDKIVAVDGKDEPIFTDITRAVVLGGGDVIRLDVRRGDREMVFHVEAEYNDEIGHRVIGIVPPVEPIVTGLAKIGGPDGRSPAREAGVRLGDRILAINGKQVQTAMDLDRELTKYPNDRVELLIERDEQMLTLTARTEPVPRYVVGISGMSATIESMEKDGVAERAGLRVGDRIATVNGLPARSVVDLQEAVRLAWGEMAFGVERGSKMLTRTVQIPHAAALDEFLFSLAFGSGATLAWVEQDGPAWSVGIRPGDTIVSVGGEAVESWADILERGDWSEGRTHEVRWSRDGEPFSAIVTPIEKIHLDFGHLGVIMRHAKGEPRRYSAVGAISEGFSNTVTRMAEVLLMLRGFATNEVSPRHLGGIVTIAYVSYQAAREGLAKLVYITAFISAVIALFNMFPIPVLDGGHLLFLAIEKVRGRRLGERVMTAAQAVGFAFLMILVVYVTRNDILRLLQWR